MTKIYIHGANATSRSFNYIREHCGEGIALSYRSDNGFRNNLEIMKKELENVNELEFIAHSLGGIYAVHLADYFRSKTKGGVTISTPYAGLYISSFLYFLMPWYALLKDINPNGEVIRNANNIKLTMKWCNIVSTSGNAPWIHGPNDGVVTVASQRHRNDIELIDINCNHYEVVLDPKTVEIINNRLK